MKFLLFNVVVLGAIGYLFLHQDRPAVELLPGPAGALVGSGIERLERAGRILLDDVEPAPAAVREADVIDSETLPAKRTDRTAAEQEDRPQATPLLAPAPEPASGAGDRPADLKEVEVTRIEARPVIVEPAVTDRPGSADAAIGPVAGLVQALPSARVAEPEAITPAAGVNADKNRISVTGTAKLMSPEERRRELDRLIGDMELFFLKRSAH